MGAVICDVGPGRDQIRHTMGEDVADLAARTGNSSKLVATIARRRISCRHGIARFLTPPCVAFRFGFIGNQRTATVKRNGDIAA